jgi:hypothetical protein
VNRGPRCTHGQGVPTRLPLAHRTCTHSPDTHCADVRRLDLGPGDSPLPRPRCPCRLLVRCVSSQTRTVRDLSSLLVDKQDQTVWKRLTSVLSINAAISAVVVLASRLHDDLAVFALMLFSVEAFALFPIFRRRIQVSITPTGVLPCLYSNIEHSQCRLLFKPLFPFY